MDVIISGITSNHIVAIIAEKVIIAKRTQDDIIIFVTMYRVCTIAPVEIVISRTAINMVIAGNSIWIN